MVKNLLQNYILLNYSLISLFNLPTLAIKNCETIIGYLGKEGSEISYSIIAG